MTKNQRNLIKRRQKGNMLVFATAITVFLVAVLAFFSLGYVRLLGSNSEQRNAIEAASLAAARDLSMIAVDTDEYGWVSVSDSAPTGSATTAVDAYNVPVRGMNSILGTIRLDLIIANELGDADLKYIIKADLVKAKAAQATLAAELQKAIVANYIAKDINNNPINVYKDAEDAYTSNQIRMTGSSNYVKNSLKLSLGSITNGGITNTPLPNPKSKANVPSGGSQNDFYLSYFNQTFDGEDFVFAGIGDSIKLIDAKQWTPSIASLPYQMQTIVKAEADQQMNNGQNGQAYTIHAIACAQPANVADPKPAPGALSFSFPDGIPPEIQQPIAMFTDGQLNSGNNCNIQTSKDGDYPIKPAQIADLTWPYPSLPESTGNVFRLALFDWWKRAGTKLNVASAVSMMTDPTYKFKQPSPLMVDWKAPEYINQTGKIYNLGPIPDGTIHIYRIAPASGQISYQDKQLAPIQYSVAGDEQLYSENIDGITKSAIGTQKVGPFDFPNTGYIADEVYLKPVYDVYIRDQVFHPGKVGGVRGIHAGEPMDYPLVSHATTGGDLGGAGFGAKKPPSVALRPKGVPPAITNQSDFAETAGFPLNSTYYNQYSKGPGAKNMRPTYQKNGMAVDVRFRRQVDTGTFKDSLGFSLGYVGEKYPPGYVAEVGVPYVPPPTPPTPPTPPAP